MSRVIPLEQAQARFQERARRYAAAQPQTFRGACLQMHVLSKNTLAQMVYGTSKPGHRSAKLKNSELLHMEGNWAGIIRNTASSVWRGTRAFYAWFVAKGLSTRDKGSRYYAWMRDPRQPRPTTFGGWMEERAAGRAVLAHRLRAVPGRDWRKRAIEQARAQGLFARFWRDANREASQ